MVPRIFPTLLGVSLVAAACGPPQIAVETVEPGDADFVRQVVDIEGDVGQGLSLTTDADGNPHMAYLAFEAELEPGEAAPPVDPLAATLPAVKHAHLIGGVWTKTTVADDLREQPEEGEQEEDPEAPPPEPGPPLIEPQDETAIAVDEPGTHHVAWTQGRTIQYASTAEGGEFGDPEVVFEGSAAGLSIAADGDGAPWIAFYEEVSGPEGPGALVRVASRDGDAWTVETAAEADVTGPTTTGIGVQGGEALVAYSSAGNVSVARSTGDAWESEEVTEGVGVSLDLDEGGNPHVAFYTGQDVGHAHAVGGPDWEITPVGEAGSEPESDWTTSIALAEDGTHHVAWQVQGGLGYANNADGEFQEEEMAGSEGAWRPRAAAGAGGDVYLAWYDQETQVLTMAGRTADAPFLAAPAPEPGQEEGPGPPEADEGGPPPCGPNGNQVTIAAPPGAAASGFDTECLAVSPDEPFTVEFNNDDDGVPHNWTVYETQEEAASFSNPLGGAGGPTESIQGPDSVTYEVDALEQGRYFYHCDLHIATMTGTLVVE